MAELKITLVKSTIGALDDQQATVKALGLRKTNSTVSKQAQPHQNCEGSGPAQDPLHQGV